VTRRLMGKHFKDGMCTAELDYALWALSHGKPKDVRDEIWAEYVEASKAAREREADEFFRAFAPQTAS